jgi:hypothetical protein
MGFFDIVLAYLPAWIIGLGIFFLTKRGRNGDLVRFESKPFLKISAFFLAVIAISLISFHFTSQHRSPDRIRASLAAVSGIPIWISLFVGWEDMVFGVPLAAMGIALKGRIGKVIYKLAMVAVMACFGYLHLYQGLMSAIILSLYIPLTQSRGIKSGFGTIMACHMFYDFITIASVHIKLWMLG